MTGKNSFLFLLAKRFLLSRGVSDQFLSLIAWVSVSGVVLGVLALVVVTSVINGFENELARIIYGMNGQVILYTRGDPIENPDGIILKIKKTAPEVTAVTASFITELMVSGPKAVAGAVIEGLDTRTVGSVTSVPERVIAGHLPLGDQEVALASVLAEKIGAKVDSNVKLVFPGLQGLGQPKVISVRVVGIVQMGMYDYDSKFIFSTLGSLQQWLEQPGKVTAFKMRVRPGVLTRAISSRLSDNFGYPFRAKDWGELNKNLFYAIQLEKVVISILLTVIIVVAAFNVASSLMMMIHDKSKEIAILKAMGFRASQSFKLFCFIGVGIAMVGSGVGLLMGLGVNFLLAQTKFIQLPSDIYSLGYLPVMEKWPEIFLILGVALLIVFLATLLPAIHVSRRQPFEALKYE